MTAQIAVHKTTRNPTITNAPAAYKEEVMQSVGIAPYGAQPIVPKPLAELPLCAFRRALLQLVRLRV